MDLNNLTPEQLDAVVAARAARHNLPVEKYLQFLELMAAHKERHGEVTPGAATMLMQRARHGEPGWMRAARERRQQQLGNAILRALSQAEPPEPMPELSPTST